MDERILRAEYQGSLDECLSMVKAVLVLFGSLSLAFGVIGIFVPGLPTTVFLLISAACYVRSSERMYRWLLNHKILGRYIRDYEQHRAMPLKSKIVALVSMWTMITISTIWFIQSLGVRLAVVALGLLGTAAILTVKTLRAKDTDSSRSQSSSRPQ